MKNQNQQTIGDRIRIAREAAGISKSELARRVGVHPSACVQWESVGGTTPNVEHMAKVAEIFNVRFEWIATGRGEMVYGDITLEEADVLRAFRSMTKLERNWVFWAADKVGSGEVDLRGEGQAQAQA